ncbi:MAG: hypothetical protein AAGJ74_14210 [Pseudomonadota bacterium]
MAIPLGIAVAVALGLFAARGEALTLAECDRTTHPSHGGERGHRDLGEGRVLYGEWWSQEGVYVDLIVAHCGTGAFLKTRAREERISARAPFDRTERVLAIIETEVTGAAALFSLKRLANALKNTGEDIELATLAAEPCACAAAYPDLRGTRAPFALK